MAAVEIPRDAWAAALNAFARVHDGWLVSVELVTEAGTRTVMHHLPLAGVSVDCLHGETAIVISVARSASEYVTHVIAAARRVNLRKTNDGADAALEIESRDGATTVVTLRVAALPETVDGIVPAVTRFALIVSLACAVAASAFGQAAPPTLGTCGGQPATFKNVRLAQPVLANGQPLDAGVYEIRITTERPSPAVGQSAAGECWVEFVKNGSVAGRELAAVVASTDIELVAKGPAPRPNTTRVDALKGGEHLRVWINSAGTHYLINLVVRPAGRTP